MSAPTPLDVGQLGYDKKTNRVGTEGRSVVASVTGERDTTSIDSFPIDAELFLDTVTLAQLMELSTSTRADIDARTNELVSHLRELLGEDVWDGDDEAMGLFRQAYKHLDLSNRPTQVTSAFDAFSYMQETATLTHALLKVYADSHGTSAP